MILVHRSIGSATITLFASAFGLFCFWRVQELASPTTTTKKLSRYLLPVAPSRLRGKTV